MECFYCGSELLNIDYYGKYKSGVGFTTIDGYIYRCNNEDAECCGEYYHTKDGTSDGELFGGYPC